MITNILISILLASFIILIYYFFRNEYTFRRQIEANTLISQYMKSNSHLNTTDFLLLISQRDLMMYEYDDYLHNLFLWGKYSAIKPEYRKLLLAKE